MVQTFCKNQSPKMKKDRMKWTTMPRMVWYRIYTLRKYLWNFWSYEYSKVLKYLSIFELSKTRNNTKV